MEPRAAVLEARRTNYEAVLKCLNEENRLNPKVGEDWKESTLLAMASIVESAPFAEPDVRFHQAHPDIAAGIDQLVTSIWTSFAGLSERAESKWIYAAYQAFFQSDSAGTGITTLRPAIQVSKRRRDRKPRILPWF